MTSLALKFSIADMSCHFLLSCLSPLSHDLGGDGAIIRGIHTIGYKRHRTRLQLYKKIALSTRLSPRDAVFNKRFAELTEFKSKFGYCDVPYIRTISLSRTLGRKFEGIIQPASKRTETEYGSIRRSH